MDPNELALISKHVAGYNDAIRQAAAARANVHLVDTNAMLGQIAAVGYPVPGTTVTLTTRYDGGVFSLDGIHPSDTGYGIVANEFIRVLNGEIQRALTAGKASGFGGLRAQIPSVDVKAIHNNDVMR